MTDDLRFYNIVRAFQQGDYAQAAQLAAQSADQFFQHVATYMQRVAERGSHDVYATPAGFVAFIRGGGNVPLYTNLSAQLQQIYQQHNAIRLLDIGVGDGLALLPALTDTIAHIDLVEPAADMLTATATALTDAQVAHRVWHESAESFIAHATDQFDIAQATFCLHNLSPADRQPVLNWLQAHCTHFLLAEFDVALVPDGSAAHTSALMHRYRRGIAEYPADSIVAQQFLLPILFRNFDTGSGAQMHETTLANWQTELQTAGFTAIDSILIDNYWWADAYLLVAS